MTKEDIQNLDVNSIAADDCVLMLWGTWPCLKECLELIEKWGFTYSTLGFIWVKRNKIADSWFWGMGYWTRANSEYCLLATKGNPQRISKAVHQVLDDRIGKHSQKPKEALKRMVDLIGDVPRLEMFARDKTHGWSVFGNEVENSIEIPVKKNAFDKFIEEL